MKSALSGVWDFHNLFAKIWTFDLAASSTHAGLWGRGRAIVAFAISIKNEKTACKCLYTLYYDRFINGIQPRGFVYKYSVFTVIRLVCDVTCTTYAHACDVRHVLYGIIRPPGHSPLISW